MKVSLFGALACLLIVALAAASAVEASQNNVAESAIERNVAACPAGCSNHGTCNGNICNCDSGYGGADCSIAVRALTFGQPQSSSVGMWMWEYWSVQVPQGNRRPLLVTVDQTNQGQDADCDTYIKQGSLPSHSNYDFRDVSLDGHVEQNISSPVAGAYYIGIFAFRQCSYTIKVTQGDSCPNHCSGNGICNVLGACECVAGWTGNDCSQHIPSLTFNTPVDGAVASNGWQVFKVNLGFTYAAMNVILTQTGPNAQNADLDLYVRRGAAPSIYTFDYANGSLSITSEVHVVDAQAGDWYIGVYGYSCPANQQCNFRLTVNTDDRCPNRCSMHGFCRGTSCSCSPGFTGEYCQTMTNLMALGQSYNGYVDNYAWNYFSFRALMSGPVRVHLAPLVIQDGDCDLYIRKDAQPTIFSYDYKNNDLTSNVTLDIPNAGDNTWHIGVYGYRKCDFAIRITASTETHCLNGGVPAGISGTCYCPSGYGGDNCEFTVTSLAPERIYSGHVVSGRFDYYNFSLPETPSDVVVYLKETGVNSRGQVWLFLNQRFVPSIREHAFEDVDTNTQYHMLTVHRNQLPEGRHGPQNFIIGVYGSPYIIGQTTQVGYQLTAWATPFH